MQQENKTQKNSLTFGSIFILCFSYFFLFLGILITTVVLLSPWYEIAETAKPQIGTWQRSLNDFSSDIGGFLVALSVIIISVFIFLSKLKQKQDKNNEALNYTILNLFFLFVNYFFAFVFGWLSELSSISQKLGLHQILGLFVYLFLTTAFLYINLKIDFDLFKEKTNNFFKKIKKLNF